MANSTNSFDSFVSVPAADYNQTLVDFEELQRKYAELEQKQFQTTPTNPPVVPPPALDPTIPSFVHAHPDIVAGFFSKPVRVNIAFPTPPAASMVAARLRGLNSTLTSYILDLIREDLLDKHPEASALILQYLPEVGMSRRRFAHSNTMGVSSPPPRAYRNTKNAPVATVAQAGLTIHNAPGNSIEIVSYPDYPQIKKLNGFYPVGVWRVITPEEARQCPKNTVYKDFAGNLFDCDFYLYRGDGFVSPNTNGHHALNEKYRRENNKTLPYDRESPFWTQERVFGVWFEQQFPKQPEQVEVQTDVLDAPVEAQP